MELVTYLRLFRKWFWLLFLGAFLAGGASFLQASQRVKLYQASTTIQVGGATEVVNPAYQDILTPLQLVQTYAHLARSYDVLDAAVTQANLPLSAEGLRGRLGTGVIEGTSLLVLTVTYTDPFLAADMANAVAEQLIAQNPGNPTEAEQQDLDQQRQAMDRLIQERDEMWQQLADVDQQITQTSDEQTLSALQTQRVDLLDQINQTSANITALFQNIANTQRNANKLTIVEQARPRPVPVGGSRFGQTVVGAIIGGALAAGLVLLIEYLDDTVRSPNEIVQLLGVPTLAAITRFGKPRDPYDQRLITFRDPGSPVSEEYRTLRTNLLFSANGNTGKTAFVVTSPGPTEGKTVTTANLAVTMAMAGWRVLLVDADLRRPRIHDIFNLENYSGLSTLLSVNPNEIAPDGEEPHLSSRNLEECIQDTEIPGLSVITSGHIPLNPTEVLGSASMQRWFESFRNRDDIDIVLFDTPPSLVVADSVVLASAIDAPVVMVLEAKGTRRGAAKSAKEQFDQLDVKVAGVVLNAVNPRDRGEYGYGYGYYYYYYYADSGVKSSSSN